MKKKHKSRVPSRTDGKMLNYMLERERDARPALGSSALAQAFLDTKLDEENYRPLTQGSAEAAISELRKFGMVRNFRRGPVKRIRSVAECQAWIDRVLVKRDENTLETFRKIGEADRSLKTKLVDIYFTANPPASFLDKKTAVEVVADAFQAAALTDTVHAEIKSLERETIESMPDAFNKGGVYLRRHQIAVKRLEVARRELELLELEEGK